MSALSPAALVIRVAILLFVSNSAFGYEDCCVAESRPYGTSFAGQLLTSCKACSYNCGKVQCSECVKGAYLQDKISLADRVRMADLCMGFSIQWLRGDKYWPCMQIVNWKFASAPYEPFARCLDCVYNPATGEDFRKCHNALDQGGANITDILAKLRGLVGRTGPMVNNTYKQPDPILPGYKTNDLEPFIDNATMTLHSVLHHGAAITNLNAALSEPRAEGIRFEPLYRLLQSLGAPEVPPDYVTRLRNNGGSHYNHAFFWQVLGKPNPNPQIDPDLSAAIQDSFGNLTTMMLRFNTTANTRFGSGWGWLVVDPSCDKTANPTCKQLVVTSTPNQDNPLMKRLVEISGIPILNIDVWEHAYYLMYQNRRPQYITNFWNVVNWNQVALNFAKAKAGLVWNVKPDGSTEYL